MNKERLTCQSSITYINNHDILSRYVTIKKHADPHMNLLAVAEVYVYGRPKLGRGSFYRNTKPYYLNISFYIP